MKMDDVFSLGAQKKGIQIEGKGETGNQKERSIRMSNRKRQDCSAQGVRNLNARKCPMIFHRDEEEERWGQDSGQTSISFPDAHADSAVFPSL